MEIRLLNTIDEIAICEDIQRVAWGMDDVEVVPSPQMKALCYSGGMVAGAFDGDKPVGFILSFLARHDHRVGTNNSKNDLGIHSHMMAVIPDYQGQGIGRKLKWFQREWCLQQGYTWVSWTFDPMQAKNAKLNFEHFGAFADHYKVNVYGEMRDELNKGMESDRLLAWWDLTSDAVEGIAQGEAHAQVGLVDIPYALQIKDKDLIRNLDLDSACLRIDIPKDLVDMLNTDLDFAHACRQATREVFLYYFAKGYTARRFVESSYLLYLP